MDNAPPTKRVKIADREEEDAKQKKKQAEEAIRAAQQTNLAQAKKGGVRCNKLPSRFDKKLVDKSWPKVEGYKNINCCSGAAGVWSQLSPMKLGPIGHEEEGLPSAKNLENLWQFSKVWDDDMEENGDPNEAWYARRRAGFADKKAHRHVKKGKGPNINKPKYSWWKGEKLSYLAARRAIYCPLYAQHVVTTQAYQQLKKLVDDGYNVQYVADYVDFFAMGGIRLCGDRVLGFDGYDFAGKPLQDCFLDESRPFGHELVLCCLLLGEKPWET